MRLHLFRFFVVSLCPADINPADCERNSTTLGDRRMRCRSAAAAVTMRRRHRKQSRDARQEIRPARYRARRGSEFGAPAAINRIPHTGNISSSIASRRGTCFRCGWSPNRCSRCTQQRDKTAQSFSACNAWDGARGAAWRV